MFKIRLGIPEMEDLWNDLSLKIANKTIGKDEERLYKKWGKAMALLANDPRHPGLNTHGIDVLSRRYGERVWQSYIENRKSNAGRLYWVYGPDKGEITIIGLEPHPEDQKRDGYTKVRLSATGNEEE